MESLWDKRNRARQADEDALARRDYILSKTTKSDNEKIWNRATHEYLKENKWCNECDKRGYLVPAEYVAHIVVPKGSQAKFWDMRNWQGLCRKCHQRLVGSVPVRFLDPIPQDAKLYMVK